MQTRLWWGLAESAFGGGVESGGRFCVGAFGGGVESGRRFCVGAFGGGVESGGRFCVGAFGRNLASVTVKMLPFFIYFIQKCYK
jgi:hypothetical protein